MADTNCNDKNMGEKAIDPSENKNTENENQADAEEITEAVVSAEDYHEIDNKLDELNSALDFIEEKNDSIYNQLLDLLQSNREVREQLAQQNMPGDQKTPN